MGDFSLALNEDQLQIQKWVHEFAERTIRPAATEWDEREETPWPILEEAAKIGLYSLDFFTGQWLEPSGLGIPMAFEELYLVTLSRPPRPDEVARAQTWIASAATPRDGLQDLMWVLLNSREFLFNH